MNAIYSIPGLPSYTIDDLYPCRYEVMTFSEKELTHGWLNKIWGYIQTTFMGGGIIQTVISAVDAKSLMDRYLKERWSNKKLVEEVKKVAKEERNTTRILWGISGILDVLYAGAVALTGALIPAALFLFIALTITALGMTIGGLMSKRGFIRIMEGYTEKKLMDKCRKV